MGSFNSHASILFSELVEEGVNFGGKSNFLRLFYQALVFRDKPIGHEVQASMPNNSAISSTYGFNIS